MGADDHWTQEVRARRQSAAPAAPAVTGAPAVTAPPAVARDASEEPTRRVRPRSIRARPDRSARALDRREIQDLDLEEPPTARLGRPAPATQEPEPATAEHEPEPPTQRQSQRPPRPDPDDQLTIRLDRPD
jgi:hypothetical protein